MTPAGRGLAGRTPASAKPEAIGTDSAGESVRVRADGADAGRKVTLADVAARAGVSRSLASLVIRGARGPSEASRHAVQQAVAETGYQPNVAAKLLRQQHSRLLGVVFNPGDPFHADILNAVYPAAEERGYEVLLGARMATRSQQRAVQGLIASRCEGLVLLGAEADPRQLRTLGEQLPVAVVGRRGKSVGVDGVLMADVHGALSAVELLVGLGHRRIRLVDGGTHSGAAQRRRGYLKAIQLHGLHSDVVPGDHLEESGVRAAQTLLADPHTLGTAGAVTAVLASNDRCAVGLLDTLLRAGVDVPGEFSVVGYDDSRLARMAHINLTTVAQDADRMARLAVEAVVERLDPSQLRAPRDVLLDPVLIVRGTTGPAPAEAAYDQAASRIDQNRPSLAQ